MDLQFGIQLFFPNSPNPRKKTTGVYYFINVSFQFNKYKKYIIYFFVNVDMVLWQRGGRYFDLKIIILPSQMILIIYYKIVCDQWSLTTKK